MIFDKLWRAERKSRELDRQLREQFEPLLQKAHKATYENDNQRQNAIVSIQMEWDFEKEFNDTVDVVSTEITVRKARKLGIPLPPRPPDPTDYDLTKDLWYTSGVTGNTVLTEIGQHQLRQAIRKEQQDRLQHRMRYVSVVAAPIVSFLLALIGLIGTLIGYIAVRRMPH